jgi:hypothetical protein
VSLLLIMAEAPPADLGRLHRRCPQLVVGQAVGAEHVTQLIVPDQVNAMSERFLAASLPSPSSWSSLTQAACSTRRRSRSKFARPYMLRFSSLSLFTWPSVWPLLHSRERPAAMAA